MYKDHPVLISLEGKLRALQEQYRSQPNEQSRYQLVRLEQLIAQWAPDNLLPV